MDYHDKNIANLKAILASRGLKTSGTKAVLIQRLEEDDANKSSTALTATGDPKQDNTNTFVKPSNITLENINQMSLEERMEMRRKRFGTDTLNYKLEQRRNRFGIVTPSGSTATGNKNTQGIRRVIIS